MRYSDAAEIYRRHINPGFIDLVETLGYQRLLVKAEGCWTWDDQGRKYLDLVAGFGSMNLGHHPPALHQAITRFMSESPYLFLHTGPSPAVADFAKTLCAKLPPSLTRILFSTSGAEAVEGAIKLATLATQRERLIYVEGAFHGTSFATLALMGKKRMRARFEKQLSQHARIPYDSITALTSELKRNPCAAFIVEPILAEGGVRIPARDYLDQAREVCHRHGALLIVDEIQTGWGRTGPFLASEKMTTPPDIVLMGKALSGGLVPISVTLTSQAIHERAFRKKSDFDLHNSTFAGNALACRVASAALELFDQQAIESQSTRAGEKILHGLQSILQGHPLVREVRGVGLLIGVEIGPGETGILNRLLPGLVTVASQAAIGQWFALKLLEAGILIQAASHRWDILKFEPPLTISDDEIEFLLNTVREVFSANQNLTKIAWEISKVLAERKVDPATDL